VFTFFCQEIPWEVRLRWVKEIAIAVSHLHTYKVVHKDIKSPNFLLVNNKIKICDFGMATTASVASRISSNDTQIAGTMRWMAPECHAEDPVFDEKTDIYAMGMVFWEIVTREIPFSQVHDSQVSCLVKYEQRRPIIPADCPLVLSTLIQLCWDQSHEVRPPAEGVIEHIEREIVSPIIFLVFSCLFLFLVA
jgi:serine/threonine protein kinase